jgi:peptidoglycan/xylan/chitin deacetylase (PgdA/CDA1 family)
MSLFKKFSRKAARNFILPLTLKLKIDRILLNNSPKKFCIVNFHGVRKTNTDTFNNRHISANEFEKIIRYLKNNFNIIPLKEIFEAHRNKTKTAKKTIALTFDDGYKNNFDIALPILRKYNLPATFFIISKGLEQVNFYVWPDIVDLIKKNTRQDVKVNGLIFKYPSFYNNEVNKELLEYLKTQGSSVDLLVKELADQYSFIRTEIARLPELTELANESYLRKYSAESLIEYGSHTHSHYNLEYLPHNIVINEFTESKRIIENIINREVVSMAYPDGSYTRSTNELALQCGYKNLAVVEYKLNENNSDPNVLSRFTVSNSTTFESNALRLARQFDKYGF